MVDGSSLKLGPLIFWFLVNAKERKLEINFGLPSTLKPAVKF